jgi:hypothetical protein
MARRPCSSTAASRRRHTARRPASSTPWRTLTLALTLSPNP